MKIISIIFGIALFLLLGNSIYQEVNKSSKSLRIECHKNSTLFERVLKKELVKELQDGLKKGNFNIVTKIDKSKYMESKLFEFINKDEVEKETKRELAKLKDNSISSSSKIDIELIIYENDKEDKGKKTEKSKLYTGYLVYSFKIKNQLIYKIQIDFMQERGEDINQRIKCAIKSVMSL